MSYAVIFNTLSGHRSPRRNHHILNLLSNALPEPLAQFSVDHIDELQAALTTILHSDCHSLIIAGGDGTLNLVIDTLLKNEAYRPITLAILPNGTGNSFALDLNIDSIKDGIKAISDGSTQQVDVGQIRSQTDHRYFINNFGIGLVYDITRTAAALSWAGAFRYTLATLINLLRLKTLPLSLVIDGNKQTRNVLFLDVCNTQFTGTKMRMAPNAALNDGQFQMISVPTLSRTRLLKTFPKLFQGTHVREDFVDSQFVKHIQLNSTSKSHCILDGELSLSLPLTVTMTDTKLSFYIRNPN